MSLSNIDGHPWYREPWPWILMSGPAVVVVAGFFTAWLAFRSSDGLVADDYYKQGLSVNRVLERDKKAVELGLRADMMRSGLQLRVLLTGGTSFRAPENVSLKLMHPTHAGDDQEIALSADGQGFYSGKLSKKVFGRWQLALEDSAGQWRLYGEWLADSQEAQRLVAGESAPKIKHPLSGR